MNKIKNILSLGLLSIMALLIGFSSINYVLADDVQISEENSVVYDDFDTDLNSDDFDYDRQNTPNTLDSNNVSIMTANTNPIKVIACKDKEEMQPSKIIEMKATKAYKVTSLKHNDAIQKSYVASGYIFVSQAASNGTTYLSRCTLSGTTATYKDEMITNFIMGRESLDKWDEFVDTLKDMGIEKVIEAYQTAYLKNFGHNQTLEFYSHKNKTYVLIGCKSNTNEKPYGKGLTIQLGRIRYKAGTTISNYTQINRLVRLDCANTNGKPFDYLYKEDKDNRDNIKTVIQRMDAALSSNKNYLLLAVRSIHGHIQYSYYDFNTINNLLDKVEGQSTNYINCNKNTKVKNACKFSCVQKNEKGKKNRILPNGSCQGIDFTNAYSIYMSSGSGTSRSLNSDNCYTNYMPKIAKMVKNSNNRYSYSLCIRITNTYTSSNVTNKTTLSNYYMEIEGIQNSTNYLYFVLLPARIPNNQNPDLDTSHPEKSTTQYIYSLSKQDIENKIS